MKNSCSKGTKLIIWAFKISLWQVFCPLKIDQNKDLNNFGMLKFIQHSNFAKIAILTIQNEQGIHNFYLKRFVKKITLLCWFQNNFLSIWSKLKFLDEKSSTSAINFEVPSPLPKVNKNQERWSKVSKAKQKWFPSKYFCWWCLWEEMLLPSTNTRWR